MSTPEQMKLMRAQRLEELRKGVEQEDGVTYEDFAWLLDELKAADSMIVEHVAAIEVERAARGKLVEFGRKAQHVLTLWLAFRGSTTEEVFKATSGLAAQTTGVLNAS